MMFTGSNALHFHPCLACPGHCCSRNLINMCGYDVWTIAQELHLRPEEFLAFAQLDTEDPYNFRLDRSEKAYCLTLNMRQLPDGSRRCLFALDLPNDQVRCGIYPLRPIGCRAYPLTFYEESQDVVVKPWAFCPDGAWDPEQIDLVFWQQELARHDMEFCIHAFLAAAWNREMTKQPELPELDFRPFLDFLMDVYRRLQIVRETVPVETWPEVWKLWHRFTAKGLNPLFLKKGETAGVTSFDWWRQNIQGVVSEISQNISSKVVGRI